VPPRLKPHLVRRDVDHDLLLYDPASGELLLLNPSAAAVADLADGRRSAEDIARLISETLGADPARVADDVRTLLETLARHGALEDGP
jgi:PqqD family protein of HPr-rel-A system